MIGIRLRLRLRPDKLMPQAGIPVEICKGSPQMNPLAFRGKKARWFEYPELNGDIKSYPFAGLRFRRKKGHRQIDSIDSWKDGPGIEVTPGQTAGNALAVWFNQR